MKKTLVIALLTVAAAAWADDVKNVVSPDGKLKVAVGVDAGRLSYAVEYDGRTMVQKSALGFVADIGDFTQGLKFEAARESKVDKNYTLAQEHNRWADYPEL